MACAHSTRAGCARRTMWRHRRQSDRHAASHRRTVPCLHGLCPASSGVVRDAGRHRLHPPLLRQLAVQPVRPVLRRHAPAVRRSAAAPRRRRADRRDRSRDGRDPHGRGDARLGRATRRATAVGRGRPDAALQRPRAAGLDAVRRAARPADGRGTSPGWHDLFGLAGWPFCGEPVPATDGGDAARLRRRRAEGPDPRESRRERRRRHLAHRPPDRRCTPADIARADRRAGRTRAADRAQARRFFRLPRQVESTGHAADARAALAAAQPAALEAQASLRRQARGHDECRRQPRARRRFRRALGQGWPPSQLVPRRRARADEPEHAGRRSALRAARARRLDVRDAGAGDQGFRSPHAASGRPAPAHGCVRGRTAGLR